MDRDTLALILKNTYAEVGNWRKVKVVLGYKKSSFSLLRRIAVEGYEPKDSVLRYELGLSVYHKVAACPDCGEVHLRKRCPRKKVYKRLADIPAKELKRMLIERKCSS